MKGKMLIPRFNWWLAVLTLYGKRMFDALDMGVRPTDDDLNQLYEAAKKFVEAYEAAQNEGDGKS